MNFFWFLDVVFVRFEEKVGFFPPSKYEKHLRELLRMMSVADPQMRPARG